MIIENIQYWLWTGIGLQTTHNSCILPLPYPPPPSRTSDIYVHSLDSSKLGMDEVAPPKNGALCV
jgi:hypothetical protein